MAETRSWSGGCACGGVRYRVEGPLREIIACHCSTCRRTSGHHAAATACRTADLAVEDTGTLRWYHASNAARRGFCGHCGGHLFFERLPASGTTSIFAGTLDDTTGLVLGTHIFTAGKSAYVTIPPGLRAFEGYPAAGDMPDVPSP